MGFVLVINADQMGHGDLELGRKLLSTGLRKLANADDLDTIILYNSGVRLAVKDSYAAVELSLLHERGVEILACGTCVDHFGIRERLIVDRLSNMDEILATLRAAAKVVTL
jgi:intracellular sulfur oxidation DsrE/DsrF family protein